MQKLKVGDSFVADNTLWEVTVLFTDCYYVIDVSTRTQGNLFNSLFIDNTLTTQELDAVHTHTMKLYQGFTDTYNYCTECNHKEKA
jgi:hypothetical protein